MLAAISVAVTAIFYGRAWGFDLQCDDLLMIRPWPRAELLAVWHGTWEPAHGFAVFFRPLATWFYAGTFELFGWNAPAHMLLSLALLAGVGWLVALFVARESGSTSAGALAAALFALHPNTPWSTGTWATNDFHKVTALFALGTLLLWQRLRHRGPARWLAFVPLVLVCFLVKEDGLMLIPALLTLQWARARMVGDVKPPSVALILASAAFGAALVGWRWLALGELGGFPLPASAYVVLHNLARGPVYALTAHGSLSVLTTVEKIFAVAGIAILALVIRTMPREKRFLPAAAIIVLAWYNLPLALVSNVMRYYMLTIAAAALFAAVLDEIWRASRTLEGRRWRTAAGAAILLALASRAPAQQRELDVFSQCQRLEHECIPWVLESVPSLPPEARQYVAATTTACATGRRPRIGEANTLTWGLGATSVDTVTGVRSNGVAGDVVMLIRGEAVTFPLAVRHPGASASQPVRVEITADGQRSTRELTTPEWMTIDVPLANGWRSWLRGAHRVDARFALSGAEWRPLLVGESKK